MRPSTFSSVAARHSSTFATPTMSTTEAIPSSLSVLMQRSGDALPPLRPTKPYRSELKTDIARLAQSYPTPVAAVLHLLNDDLDAAHTLAQDDDSNRNSNLIHSILHRREGDFWNSKWWLDQFRHPYLDQLYQERDPSLGAKRGKEGAKQFVDVVERVTTKGATTACGAKRDVDAAKEWQWQELHGLAEHIFKEYNVAIEGI